VDEWLGPSGVAKIRREEILSDRKSVFYDHRKAAAWRRGASGHINDVFNISEEAESALADPALQMGSESGDGGDFAIPRNGPAFHEAARSRATAARRLSTVQRGRDR